MKLELTHLDKDCVPALGFYKTTEEIISTCFLKIYEYRQDLGGWYAEYWLKNEGLTVLLRGEVKATLNSRIAGIGHVKKVKFHHAKKVGSQDVVEPWLEIWLDEKN